jgi:hypothetical protein
MIWGMMRYIVRQDIATLVPTTHAMELMQRCKMKDWHKFQEACIQIAAWVAEAKSKGHAVGSWDLETGEKFKFYHPMLEKITIQE